MYYIVITYKKSLVSNSPFSLAFGAWQVLILEPAPSPAGTCVLISVRE